MVTIRLTEKDTQPMPLVIVGNDGNPLPLTGYSLTMKIAYTPPLQIAADIVDAANGVAQVPWTADDLKAGNWGAELLIVSPSGELTSETFRLNIKTRIV